MAAVTRVLGCGGAGCNILREVPKHSGLELRPVNNLPHPPFRATLSADSAVLRDLARGDRGVLRAYGPVVKEFQGFLEGADIAFILAGLGGKTGTWAAAAACGVATSMGILTLPLLTIPFRMEGHHRHEIAMEALPLIMDHADLTTTLSNDRLMKLLKDVPMAKAFQAMSRILATAIVTLAIPFSQTDLKLLKDYLGHRREGRLGMGQGTGRHAAYQAVEEAFESPWFDTSLEKVETGVAVVEGAEPNSATEKDVMKCVGQHLPTADVLYASAPSAGERVRVTLLLAL